VLAPVHPRRRLSPEKAEALANELDAMHTELRKSLGQKDRDYVLRVIRTQRTLAITGRALIFASIPLFPWFFHHGLATRASFFAVAGLGAFLLGIAKILENMELGHNILHGQWDWMNDPEISSHTWEWDNVCVAAQWKHSHNVVHHTWTNVVGRDRDVGYQVLRVTSEQPWHWGYLPQVFYTLILAFLFQWGVALHDIDFENVRKGNIPKRAMAGHMRAMKRKSRRQLLKDYVMWPLLAGPFFFVVLGANLVSNMMRNLWAFAIIFCGHFPSGVSMFTVEEAENESRGDFFARQVAGSCNIEGSALFHVLTGNLSHQIEHHLFPDLPSNRLGQIAPRVRALTEKYGLPYNSGSFARQLGTTFWNILKHSFPTGQKAVSTTASPSST
jgi:linoleoyl-CoA desaturase